MSFALGNIGPSLSLPNFYSIKEDQLENSDIQTYRGGDNCLFTSEKSAKAEITLDMDFVSDSDYGNLRNVMLNRQYPNKFYIREPGNISGAILTPSTTTNKAYQLVTATAIPALTDFVTEFITADYTAINDAAFASPVVYPTGAGDGKYVHFLFKFDLSAWIAAGGSLLNLLRLTLFMQTPYASRSDGANYGIKVSAYNYTLSQFVEIYRRSITLSNSNQQAAGIRPVNGFTKLSDYIAPTTNIVSLMLSVLQPNDGTHILSLYTNNAKLLVNGFMVRLADTFNLNWREAVTIVGRTGSIKLLEV